MGIRFFEKMYKIKIDKSGSLLEALRFVVETNTNIDGLSVE